MSEIMSYVPKVLKAFPLTMNLLGLAFVISIVLGALVSAGALGKNKPLAAFCRGYISFMRGIPTLVLIFLIYLGLPQIMGNFGVSMKNISKFTYIVVTLGLSASANMAEMMRTSYLAVDKGQLEAAYSVGMKYRTAFRRILFPQAFGIAIPTLGNNIIMLFKNTSLGFTVGLLDLLGKARAISAASYRANRLEVYAATGIIFWVICASLEQVFKLAERFYTKGRKKAAS